MNGNAFAFGLDFDPADTDWRASAFLMDGWHGEVTRTRNGWRETLWKSDRLGSRKEALEAARAILAKARGEQA